MTDIAIYNRFDQAALEEAARAEPADFVQSRRRLTALIDLLPQRDVIEDHHAERWLDRVLQMSLTRMITEKGGDESKVTIGMVHGHALWHVRRASAIGGSEIGTVVTHFRGERGGFSDARKLTMEKLLILAPQPGNDTMNRGVLAEPWIQRQFLEEYDATSLEADLDVLKGFRSPKAPFIVGTPDDLVVFNQDGRREIVDYKCPSDAVCEEYEKKGSVSFDYICQVHQYGFFCRECDIHYDGMRIIADDHRYYKRVTYDIPYDAELEAEMLRGADELWNNYVLKGIIPEVPGLKSFVVEDEEYLSKMEELAGQTAILKILAEEISNREKEVMNRIRAVNAQTWDSDTGKVDVGFASFSRKRDWDEKTLTGLAKSAGISLDDYVVYDKKAVDKDKAVALLKQIMKAGEADIADVPGLVNDMLLEGGVPMKQSLDLDRLAADLEEQGVSVNGAAGIKEGMLISRSKAQAGMVSKLKVKASEIADTLMDHVEDEFAEILNGEEDTEEADLEDYYYDVE